MRKPTKAIITDAGYASRYLPIAKTIPKGMLPIGNRPIMQLVVEECVAADIREIIIVATPEGKPIYEDYFNNAVNHIRKQLVAQGKENRYDAVREVLDFPKIRIIVQDPALPYGNGHRSLAHVIISQTTRHLSRSIAMMSCSARPIHSRSARRLTSIPTQRLSSWGRKFLMKSWINTASFR